MSTVTGVEKIVQGAIPPPPHTLVMGGPDQIEAELIDRTSGYTAGITSGRRLQTASQIVDPDTGMAAKIVGENSLRTISQTYEVAVTQGDIANHTAFYKLGYSPASTGSLTTLWNPGTAYVWPTSAMQMEVVSTSANDTAAGTGAQTVHVHYLDNTYAEQSTTVTLNGVTPVLTTPTNILRINSFHVLTVGTGGVAAGVISIRNATDHTTVYSQVGTGFTRSRNSVYTVPLGKTLFISDLTFSAGYSTSGKEVRLILHATYSPHGTITTAGLLFFPWSEIVLMDSVYSSAANVVLRFPATVDIKSSVIGETNAITTSSLRGWLE